MKYFHFFNTINFVRVWPIRLDSKSSSEVLKESTVNFCGTMVIKDESTISGNHLREKFHSK